MKNRVHELMDNVSWVVGIDIGKENPSSALMKINKALICRFDTEGSLSGYIELMSIIVNFGVHSFQPNSEVSKENTIHG